MGLTPSLSILKRAGSYLIVRKVRTRKVLPDGLTPEGYQEFTKNEFVLDSEWRTVTTIDHKDASGNLLAREAHHYFGSASGWSENPDFVDPTNYTTWKEAKEYKTEQFAADGTTLLRTTDQTWVQRPAESGEDWWNRETPPYPLTGQPPNDPRITPVVTTLENQQTGAKVEYDYDLYNNRTNIREFDYGEPVGGLVRQTVTAFVTSQFGPNYATNSSIHLRRLPKSREVKNAGGQRVALTEYFYDESSPASYGDISGHCSTAATISGTCALTASRGNLNRVVRWKDATASVTQSQTFDIAGNVLSATDGRGYTTTASYADDFQTSPNLPGGQATHAYPTLVTQPSPFSFTSKAKYDYYLGRPTLSEDANGVQTRFTYETEQHKLDRLKEVVRADNKDASVKQKTTFTYNDASSPVNVETASDQISFADERLRSRVEFDGLGRQAKTIQFEDSDQIEIETEYDAAGRVWRVSNPRRPAQALKWTTTVYDALGRVKTTTTSDLAVAAIDYDLNYAAVTDQDANTRKNKTDALGRLREVVENPSGKNGEPIYTTTYTYDELDNLKGVTQDGQTRTFQYDWLGRLTSALNPETGPVAVSYTYDNNGNLETRTDARGTTSSGYDGLNRIMVKTYSHAGAEATPAAVWCYDGKTYSGGACTGSITTGKKGLLTAAGNGASVTTFDQFDDLGRVKASTQTTEGQSYGFGYTYNLAGGLTQVTYPSGKAIGYSFDKAGRVSGVSGYTSDLQYRAHGALRQMTLGNGLVEKWEYNEDRLQPVSIKLGTSGSPSSVLELGLQYCPGGDCTKNNGNVRQQAITVPSMAALTQAYTYDAVNRLMVAAENPASLSNPACPDDASQWCWKFGYDPRGNRRVDARSHLGVSPIEPASFTGNNRIADTGWQYDGSGNVKQNPANETFTYDGENRLIASTGTAAASYAYDGDGRRVKRVAGGTTTVYVYDAAGQLAAEYTAGGSAYTGRRYLTADHLGTTRVITDSTGQVVERRDYHAFGEEILVASGTPRAGIPPYTLDAALALKFTGKERDTETGLDYFEARYMSADQGRFTTPDPNNAGARPEDPQSWNMYAYARNNPLLYTDQDGRKYRICDTNGNCYNDYSDADFDTYLAGSAKDGKISQEGEVIGTYERLSFDDLSPLANLFFNEMSLRREASNQFIADFAKDSVKSAVIGAGVGKAVQAGVEAYLAYKGTQAAAAEVTGLVVQAVQAAGNKGAVASSKEVALQAAEEWVGVGARSIYRRGTSEVIGKVSADGQRIYRTTSLGKAEPYVNLESKASGGNLHVRF